MTVKRKIIFTAQSRRGRCANRKIVARIKHSDVFEKEVAFARMLHEFEN